MPDDIQNVEFACNNCKIKLEYYRRDCNYICNNTHFNSLVFSFKYNDVIRKLILDFKFENKKYLYSFFAYELSNAIKRFCIQNHIKFDYIIAVPISFKRYLERGYNQSYLIAQRVSTILGVPVLKYHLIKYKNNKRQSELSHSERRINAQGVYKIRHGNDIKRKNIILIDDIYTTGATVNECSKALKASGADYILVATCTRAF